MSPCNAAWIVDRRPKRVKRVILDKAVYELAAKLAEGEALEAREARDFLLRAFSYARGLRTVQGSRSVRVELVCNSGSRASRAPRARSDPSQCGETL